MQKRYFLIEKPVGKTEVELNLLITDGEDANVKKRLAGRPVGCHEISEGVHNALEKTIKNMFAIA